MHFYIFNKFKLCNSLDTQYLIFTVSLEFCQYKNFSLHALFLVWLSSLYFLSSDLVFVFIFFIMLQNSKKQAFFSWWIVANVLRSSNWFLNSGIENQHLLKWCVYISISTKADIYISRLYLFTVIIIVFQYPRANMRSIASTLLNLEVNQTSTISKKILDNISSKITRQLNLRRIPMESEGKFVNYLGLFYLGMILFSQLMPISQKPTHVS